MKLNKQAWEMLTEDERIALGLKMGMNKSTWEAGEILDRSHYKYLEIQYRAKKFLEMFTEHLELYRELIPKYIQGDSVVKKYLEYCMVKRMKTMAAITEINNNDEDRVYSKADMNNRIIEQIRKWGRSENVYELSIFNIVKEFDRWNNFRILPRELQEPSAFKRRIKNMYKKHIRVFKIMPDLSKKKLKQLVETKNSPFGYLPMITRGKIEILKVKENKNTIPLFVDLCLYVFKVEDEAKEYITDVFHYVNMAKKDCKDGINFWNKYRDHIGKANNFEGIQKITATRSHLELAMEKLEYF